MLSAFTSSTYVTVLASFCCLLLLLYCLPVVVLRLWFDLLHCFALCVHVVIFPLLWWTATEDRRQSSCSEKSTQRHKHTKK